MNIILFNKENISIFNFKKVGQLWRRGTKCDCKRDKLWVRFPLEEMKYLIFPFSSLWCRGKPRRLVPPLNSECFKNSVESGKRKRIKICT